MKQIAYIIGAGTLISTLMLACSDDTSGGGTGTFAGQGGNSTGGTTSTAGNGGTNNSAGKNNAGTSNNNGGSGGDPNMFGGGGNDQAGSDQGGNGQGGSGGNAATDCQTCAMSNCGTEIGACQGDPECVEIIKCVQAKSCADQGCLDMCSAQHPNAKGAFDAFSQCLDGKCGMECDGGGGVKCTDIMVSQKPACNTCVHTSCCSQLEVCVGNPDCVSLNNCLVEKMCQDQECANMCASANQNGVQSYNSFAQCLQQSCMSECQ